ncbi:MAG TPA: ABC-2 family transporter protein [Chloroflexota bacterium]|nr:ABC-2 family transporter protein [Chloroflexota bacterium]
MIRRLFRLWRLFGWLDFVWMTRDLTFFSTYLVSEAVLNIANVGGTFLLAERFGGIGAWTRDEVLFMLGYGTLVTSVVFTFFGYNVSHISRRVGRGQLDHALIQPQPVWMGLLTDGFNPFGGSAGLIPGIALILWAGRHLTIAVTPIWLALFAVNLIGSCAIALAFSFFWGSLAFWAPRAAEEITSSTWRMIEQLKTFPLDGVGASLGTGLLTVLPVGFVAWYPCRALLGLDPNPFATGVTPVAAIVFVAIAVSVFRKGMQHYGRTGSQRYLSMGHRG